MCKRMKKFFSDNDGGVSELVATTFSILAIIMFFLVICAGLGAMNKYTALNNFGDEMALQVSQAGRCTGAEVDRRYTELKNATGLSPIITYAADYFEGSTKKVQYGDSIGLTLVVDTQIKAFEGVAVPITLKIQKTTLSQQYWK